MGEEAGQRSAAEGQTGSNGGSDHSDAALNKAGDIMQFGSGVSAHQQPVHGDGPVWTDYPEPRTTERDGSPTPHLGGLKPTPYVARSSKMSSPGFLNCPPVVLTCISFLNAGSISKGCSCLVLYSRGAGLRSHGTGEVGMFRNERRRARGPSRA